MTILKLDTTPLLPTTATRCHLLTSYKKQHLSTVTVIIGMMHFWIGCLRVMSVAGSIDQDMNQLRVCGGLSSQALCDEEWMDLSSPPTLSSPGGASR